MEFIEEDSTEVLIIYTAISLALFITYLICMYKCLNKLPKNWYIVVAVLIWIFFGPVGLILYHLFIYAAGWADKHSTDQHPVQGFNPAILVPEVPARFNQDSQKVTITMEGASNSGPFVLPGPMDSALPYPGVNTQEAGTTRRFLPETVIPMMDTYPPSYDAAVESSNVPIKQNPPFTKN